MQARIEHLHCRYRVLGGATPPSLVATRLDGLARERLGEALADALARVLGNDGAVYVIRQVQPAAPAYVDARLTDAELARRWAAHLAGAIARDLAAGGSDGNVVRFAGQPEYLAQFCLDLLAGQAWDRWFYGPFRPWQGLPPAAALAAVLLDQRSHLTETLRILHTRGSLGRVLAALDEVALRTLWQSGLREVEPSGEAHRSLFAAALGLCDRLALWRGDHPSSESLFQAYLAHGPAAVDWRDRRSLAAAVLDALRFLARQGYVALGGHRAGSDTVPPPGQARSLSVDGSPGDSRLAPNALAEALAPLDWLDTDWLRDALSNASLSAGRAASSLGASAVEAREPVAQGRPSTPASPQTPPVQPSRSASASITPRQRDLLRDLTAAASPLNLPPPSGQAAVPAAALRLYAALTARAPQWSDDVLALALIQRLVETWVVLSQARRPADILSYLARGDAAGALALVAEGDRAWGGEAFRVLARLGAPALAVLDALAGGQPGRAAEQPPSTPSLIADASSPHPASRRSGQPWLQSSTVIETECAGIALLLRAVLDARLASLAETAGYPSGWSTGPLAPLLVALGQRWAAAPGEAALDPGLLALAGQADEITPADLRAWGMGVSDAQQGRFQAALLRLLARQRVVQRETLHLFQAPADDAQVALVGGDASGVVWPLERLAERDAIPDVVAHWLALWQEATGARPDQLVWPASLAPSLPASATLDWPVAHLVADAAVEGEVDEAATHRAGRAALTAALRALDTGGLGLPALDLTLGLTAAALLRLWGRWLRQFATSSVPYLLKEFIRRPGRLSLDANALTVELEPRPLDLVLEMAGYLDDLEGVSWLGGRTVRFRRG